MDWHEKGERRDTVCRPLHLIWYTKAGRKMGIEEEKRRDHEAG